MSPRCSSGRRRIIPDRGGPRKHPRPPAGGHRGRARWPTGRLRRRLVDLDGHRTAAQAPDNGGPHPRDQRGQPFGGPPREHVQPTIGLAPLDPLTEPSTAADDQRPICRTLRIHRDRVLHPHLSPPPRRSGRPDAERVCGEHAHLLPNQGGSAFSWRTHSRAAVQELPAASVAVEGGADPLAVGFGGHLTIRVVTITVTDLGCQQT